MDTSNEEIMETLEAIKQRRSVKHYDTQYDLSDEEINKILNNAVLSPTSFNIQNWRFLIVKDKEIRQQIREAAWDQAQITEASTLIVVCADTKAWEKKPERYWRNAPKEVQDKMVPLIRQFYQDRDQIQRDEAIRSCGIAAQTIMLTAKELGYDSCPMIGFDPNAVAEIINLPQDHLIGLLIVVGKAVQPARPRGGQLDLNEVVIWDKFN
ncbi:MAG: nitroreductase family protein [Candidatus Caenarcaniphilales bacterium]|nr:nitroreductase family protein [Candidatus Caenarcaniphilales bacterium]